MKNLKVSIYLNSPVILNRYLTIDNILLYLHFNRLKREGKIKGFIDTEKYIKENKNSLFLDYKNGVLSGSIWYLERDEPIILENHILIKKVNTKKIYEKTGKKVEINRGEFKAYRIGFEAMRLDKIHFYIRGDEKYIKTLLKDLKFIGKKGNIGFGRVKGFEIKEINTDKSFMLDETTPSKPLPVSKWSVKSKKIAFYRALPPYYLKRDLEACYMPTRSLIERKDNSFNKDFKVANDLSYISATKFAREYSGLDKSVEVKVKKGVEFTDNNDKLNCIICGNKAKGIIGNPKKYLPLTFNDYAFLDKGDFICEDCYWSMKNEKLLGNTFIDKNGLTYLQGGKMKIKNPKQQQKFRDEFFRNLDKLTPPFLISFKSTPNSQHTIFKNKVAISNTMIPVSFGVEEEILLDVELFKEAIDEMKKILKNHTCIKKPHLLNTEKIEGPFPRLSKKCTKEDLKVLQDFWRKYDRSVRKILNRIIIQQ